MSQRFFASGRSEVGLHRTGNEDSALINGVLIAVADGMGGHAGGEVASKVAITTLAQVLPLLNNNEMDPESLEDFLLSALLDVDDEIKLTAEADDRLSGMGTTLTSIALYREMAYVLHIGDSRAYRLRGKEFTQLTKDHSVVQVLPLLNNNEMDPESLEDFLLSALLDVDDEIKLTAEADVVLS